MKSFGNAVYRNLANLVSVLGVLPLCLLLSAEGHAYLPALILYNNVMDDLDGILAAKLGIKSRFGALLDNVCDAVAHILIVIVIGAFYGTLTLALCTLPATAILFRVTSRIDRPGGAARGTPTNELMRHLLLILLLERAYQFDPTWALSAAFLLNSISMLVPFAVPHPIRTAAKTATSITLVNVALAVAWWVPAAVPFIAAPFLGAYLYSLAIEMLRWCRESGRRS